MKMVKGLTKANAAKYGIEVRPDLDFTDDGNRFRGFSYKGLPMTQCRTDNTCCLAIRVDYLKQSEVEFTYNEWMKTEERRLCYEFNGVAEFDIEKLIENLEKVLAKVAEMNAAAKAETVDITPVKEKLHDEIYYAEDVVSDFKHNFKWYEASSYQLNSLIGYMNGLNESIEKARQKLTKITSGALDNRTQREMAETLKIYGFVDAGVRPDNFYIKQLLEALGK